MRVQRGFTLIELMIVVAIIAILAAIAIPQYQDFVSRTRASGAMTELGGYRHAVSECISLLSTATGCSAGSNGIPPVLTAFSRNVTAMASVTDGVITATSGATDGSGGTNLTIIDTPSAANPALITWTNNGTICHHTRGLRSGQGDCP